ncbi:hypothetical protein [Cupriavidus sp. TMH.W2]|uniref:hypothetical protein n=1 Tax=Cupriavidus sp. TMH.W2 TaxID=3434465 RepID=UPI003D7869AD
MSATTEAGVDVIVSRYGSTREFLLALADWARTDSGSIAVARRFGDPDISPISGRELKQLRTRVLELSQDEIADLFKISRNSVSRIETKAHKAMDGKSVYAYLGVVFVHFIVQRMLQEDPRHE